MKRATKLPLTALVGVFALVLAVPFFVGISAQAQENNQQQQQEGQNEEERQQEDQEQAEQQDQPDENEVYQYVAQPGDSYTLMARKAVQTYGLTEDVRLSPAQIIFAETMLTQAAGLPQLNVGERVEITKSLVGDWVQNAQDLSPEALENWEYYVQFVESFNTDNVGEPRE